MVMEKGLGTTFPVLIRLMCSIIGWLGNSVDSTQSYGATGLWISAELS